TLLPTFATEHSAGKVVELEKLNRLRIIKKWTAIKIVSRKSETRLKLAEIAVVDEFLPETTLLLTFATEHSAGKVVELEKLNRLRIIKKWTAIKIVSTKSKTRL